MPARRTGSRSRNARRSTRDRSDRSRRAVAQGTSADRVASRPRISIASQPWRLLVPHLEPLGIDVEATIDRIRRYAGAVLDWNQGVSNLVSRSDEARLVERHLVECLEPAAWLASSRAARWPDLG